jgi:hypothetical protein
MPFLNSLKVTAATLLLAAAATTATEFIGFKAAAPNATLRGSASNVTESSLATGSKVTITYYSDKACSQKGGGPPGLIANPFHANVGSCKQLLSNGFSIEVIKCGGGSGSVSLYPKGCGGIKTVPQSAPTDVCSDQGGIYSRVTCP